MTGGEPMGEPAEQEAEPFIDVLDVCRWLGVNRKWVYRVIANDDFPAYRLSGGMYRFLRSEILVWLSEHRKGHIRRRGRPRSIVPDPDK